MLRLQTLELHYHRGSHSCRVRPFVQLRGVPAMRYHGDHMASAELEARWQFFGRWSIVGFGRAGTTHSYDRAFTATQNVGSGGVGFGYELACKFGLHGEVEERWPRKPVTSTERLHGA